MSEEHEAVEPDPREDLAAADTAQEQQEVEAEVANELVVLQRERDELADMTRRLQADFENYRKRVLREQTSLVERATEGLIEQLLPVLDNFELAVMNLGDVDEKVRKGLELVYASFLDTLERNGLERIDAHGAVFDPNEHEAVQQDEGEGEPHVSDVLRTGWKLKGRVLRPAMVKVSRH